MGSAPCRLTSEQIAEQNEAATARAQRFEREQAAKQRAEANCFQGKQLKPSRPIGISTSTRWR